MNIVILRWLVAVENCHEQLSICISLYLACSDGPESVSNRLLGRNRTVLSSRNPETVH